MALKRLSLTVSFCCITLFIGLVSVNLPLSSYAQNNVLGQNGNGLAEQETAQSQSSQQNNLSHKTLMSDVYPLLTRYLYPVEELFPS